MFYRVGLEMTWNWRVWRSGSISKGEIGVRAGVLWVSLLIAGFLGFFCGFLMNRECSDQLLREKDGVFWASAVRIFDQESEGSVECQWESCGNLAKLLLKIFFLSAMVAALANRKASVLLLKFNEFFAILRFRQKKSAGSSKCGVWRKKLLFAGVISGVLISLWIYLIMSANTRSRHEENLANMCDERARMLQDQFNVSMNHVHALAILVSTFHHGKKPSAVDQKTFAEYTARTAFERPLTSGVAYAPRVVNSERDLFEREQGWTIKKMETEDQSPVRNDYAPERLDPCPVQDEYAPVIFSQETVSHIVSIDMMSGKEDRENILRARATGKGVLTSPFKLLKSNHLGVVLTFAVYDRDLPPESSSEDRIGATVGYLGASFDVPSLVEKLLQQLASKQKIVVNVYDTTNGSSPIRMYGPDAADTGLLHVSHVDFGDPMRKHEMHCRFKQKLPPPWSAVTTSAGVLVIVLLLGHIFHAAISRIEKVEDDYNEMRELKGRAEAADVAKSQFLATVSHEIRTPMNGVLGMLQMLMDTDLDATQLDYAVTAQDSGKALIALINEVLDQAKIESGRIELEAVPFDVRAVLDSVLSLFSDKSLEKGIELAVWVSEGVPEVLVGDPGRFRQIITNLVGNSIKFTENGHIFVSLHLAEEARSAGIETDPSLTLSGSSTVDRWKIWEKFKMVNANSTSSWEADSVNVLVTVEDTGVGIPPEAQARVFTPFMQADSSTSRTYGGTGIGLSISKCLVHLMGGEIGFASESGIGSTFSFSAAFRVGHRRISADDPDFLGMTALVVDQRSVRADVTKYHLRRLGVNANVVVDRHLDMVLVDEEAWNEKLLTELRQREKPGKRLKIFMLAAPRRRGKIRAIDGLADGVMRKPLRASVISACVRQAMGVKMEKRTGKGRLPGLRSTLNGRRILVVDDNAVNRKVAAGALKKFGADITCVDCGKAAVEKLCPPHDFDACFMDVQMPEMDGFEATTLVRSLEKKVNEKKEANGEVGQWHVPILAMTADVIQATHEECARCGMDGYVSKPFEEEQLYATVARFFQGDKSSDGQSSSQHLPLLSL